MTKIKRNDGGLPQQFPRTYIGPAAWHMLLVALLLLPLCIAACSDTARTSAIEHGADPSPSQGSTSADGQTFALVGAGDIAGCKDLDGARATAKLLEHIPGTIFAAGDLAYEKGSAADFRNCYDTTWGEFKARTRPTLANHEYAEAT